MKNTILFLCILFTQTLGAQTFSTKVIPAAEIVDEYYNLIKNKRVAVLVNQTSVIHQTHLVDSLLHRGINIVKIFAPEHGFRGTENAGEDVKNSVDVKTGLTISSMYGATKKPTAESMQNIDIVLFDIQDVGARFYTYISSLQYMMEACAENKIPMVILDRPNPNGFYIDGPVLEATNKSFVGMQAIPIVHGMTVGEYAMMLNGERGLNNNLKCNLTVIPCKNYDHSVLYECPIAPSPNLKSASAILLYPSLCLFEGTVVSVGRGTEFPFEMWGHPDFKTKTFSFTPVSTSSAKTPVLENKVCYGVNLHFPAKTILQLLKKQMRLSYLKSAYAMSADTAHFFNDFFIKLAGTPTFKQQIIAGKSEEEIRNTWKSDIAKFKKIRKKYLLYADFE